MKPKTFVIGDVHGRSEALKQCLKRAKFNKEKDTLICLGDVCDGGPHTRQAVQELLKIKKLIMIRSNHDDWFIDWFEGGPEIPVWTQQGGQATLRSYDFKRENVPQEHKKLFKKAALYYIDKKNRIFVHGGFDPETQITEQSSKVITWDRSLISYAMKHEIKSYNHVFVGHTTTQLMGSYWDVKNCQEPITFNNLTMMDTGSGWKGKLTILDVNTFEFWQSDNTEKTDGGC